MVEEEATRLRVKKCEVVKQIEIGERRSHENAKMEQKKTNDERNMAREFIQDIIEEWWFLDLYITERK